METSSSGPSSAPSPHTTTHISTAVPADAPQMPAVAANPAKRSAILLLIVAAAITLGTFSKSWGTGRELGDGGAGLLGMSACRGSVCQGIGWSELERRAEIPGDVGIFGVLGMIAGALAAVGCATAGGLALSRRLENVPVMPLLVLINAAAFAQTFFVFRLLSTDRDIALSLGWSPFLAIGGLVGAGAVLQKGLRPRIVAARA